MRLLGCVFDDGGALCQHRGHHDIHGGAHGHHIQIYGGTGEPALPGTGLDETALHLYLGAHGAKALDMLVDGPYAEVAAAGHGHLGLSETAQQGADEVVGGPDAAGHIVGGIGGTNGVAVQLNGVPVQHPDPCAQFLQNVQQQCHIADLRDILNAADTVHQQGGGNNGNGGIFGPAYGDLTE